MSRYTIGQLAKQAGIGVETVRYYERRLLAEPPRSDSGYRLYLASDLERLRFIRRAKSFGFSLREIGELLTLKSDAQFHCHEVRQRTIAKLAEVEARIDELVRVRDTLSALVGRCLADVEVADCPIIGALDGSEPSKA